jgi:hypothetical protein
MLIDIWQSPQHSYLGLNPNILGAGSLTIIAKNRPFQKPAPPTANRNLTILMYDISSEISQKSLDKIRSNYYY